MALDMLFKALIPTSLTNRTFRTTGELCKEKIHAYIYVYIHISLNHLHIAVLVKRVYVAAHSALL